MLKELCFYLKSAKLFMFVLAAKIYTIEDLSTGVLSRPAG